MIKNERVKCEYCGSEELELLDQEFCEPVLENIFRCKKCGKEKIVVDY